ncbi:MAG: putative toxin-antitoxin system toxin component, PIN family [Chitinispirillaceae bacterium]|nr:putative toxin-antitoxin system toxin component, PIN family [Chitinispirillaceae bacterium]
MKTGFVPADIAEELKKPPVVVIDTTILISYLFGGTTITSLIDVVGDDAYLPALSPYLEQEFVESVRKPKIARRVDTTDALDFMREWKDFSNFVMPRCRVSVCRDHADNEVLACALEASADYVISGDTDLLILKNFHGIQIISPSDFVKTILRLK